MSAFRTARWVRLRATAEFFNLLTSSELLLTTEALQPVHSERLYPPPVALSIFMRQVLEADGSCQRAVNGWAAQRTAAPDAITLREVKVAHQVRVTTLLDHRRVSKADLSSLYACRWNVELDLRNLKTTTRHARSELPDAADEREAAVGSLVGLQRDQTTHGAGRQQRQRGHTRPELQAHGAAVDAVDGATTMQRE